MFFDALGIAWEYEPQGYVVGSYNPRRYLPDFWLPRTETWVEVKGSDAAVDWDFLADACDYNSALPGMQDSLDTSHGLLLLGPVPAGATQRSWRHIGIQHYKGVIARYFYFSAIGPRNILLPAEYPNSPGYGEASSIPRWSWRVYGGGNGNGGHMVVDPPSIEGVPGPPQITHFYPRIGAAYAAARSARFEHGQSGAPG